jgi:ATP-dependent 26S proteasome regulatory subunit
MIINTTNDITLQINEAPNILSYDITTKFKLYNISIPLWVFIKNEDIDINKCTPNTRVSLRSDSYTLHKILPTKVDPLVPL